MHKMFNSQWEEICFFSSKEFIVFILRRCLLDSTWPRRQDNWQVMSWKEFERNQLAELKETQQKVFTLIIRYLSQDSKRLSGNLGV
jgi:hypothetical protein